MKSFKAALKGLKRPSATPAAAPRPSPPEPVCDFKSLFRDVTPLKDSRRVFFASKKPSPHPRHQPRGAEFQPLIHASGWFEPADSDNSFIRSGMQTATLKRLRALHWPICAELDLHGLDRFEAQEQLTVFLHRARHAGVCVRVIHGKGISSRGEPVLKRMTRSWLSQHPDVLAFCETSGGGALLVLLRRMPD